MGKRGAPVGNQNGSHDKPWTDALRRVLAQLEVKDKGEVKVKAGEALRHIAESTVLQAIAGDKDARTEIANRLDGKPKEELDVTHHRDPKEMSTDALIAEIRAERGSAQRTAETGRRKEQPPSVH